MRRFILVALKHDLKAYPNIDTQSGKGRPWWLIAPDTRSLDFQYAAAVCSNAGAVLGRRSSCIYFRYFSENGSKQGFAVVPLNPLLAEAKNASEMDELIRDNTWTQYEQLSFTGIMDGDYMTLLKIEGANGASSANREKHTLFEDSAAVPEGTELVTLTTDYQNLGFIYSSETDGVSYGNNLKFKSLDELIDKIKDYNIVDGRHTVFTRAELKGSIDVSIAGFTIPEREKTTCTWFRS